MTEGDAAWRDAVDAAGLFAADPVGLGGIVVRAAAGPVRDRFLALLPGPMRRLPPSIADDALLGGIDLPATLASARAVRTRGLLAEAAGGVVLATMAERMPAALAARLGAALDGGAGFGVVALDEGEEDERASSALADRLAFHVDLRALGHRDAPPVARPPAAPPSGAPVEVGDEVIDALSRAALALGVASPRASILALRAARAAALRSGRAAVSLDDAALAARLVLAPRATVLPAEAQAGPDTPPPAPAEDSAGSEGEGAGEAGEIVLQAARAAIPAGLLARLQAAAAQPVARSPSQGRVGTRQKGLGRGRPIGVRAQAPGPGRRLALVETLRAAAPWQRLRAGSAAGPGPVRLRREDFRIIRTEQRAHSTTIFLLDASGSAALNRLAEAKGAVELLLADCYRRRDRVAVIAFRGVGATLLLPPTRSLTRARRCLAALPGGGGTPLAAGLDSGLLLAAAERRGGATPALVLLTDGRANVGRAGPAAGRAGAERDALHAARRLRAAGLACLLLDTSPRPAQAAQRLAGEMGARYVPMPYASAAGVSAAVRAALPQTA